MAKYVQTADGIVHTLPDYVTDENYSEEKEKFLAAYNQPEITPEITAPVPEEESSFGKQVIGGALQAKNAANFYALSGTAPELLEKQQLLDNYIALEGIRPLTPEQEEDKEQLILDIKGTGESQEELDKKRKDKYSFKDKSFFENYNRVTTPPMAQALGNLLEEREYYKSYFRKL